MTEIFSRKTTVFFVIAIFFITAFLQINGSGIATKSDVDIKTAANVAQAKIFQLGKGDFSISGKTAFYEGEKPLFYVFHLQPRGYVVVSADFFLPPVIAYSFRSNFYEGRNMLGDMLSADISLRLKNIHYLPGIVIDERKKMWKSMLNFKNDGMKNNFEQWPPEGTTSTGGWLETEWS